MDANESHQARTPAGKKAAVSVQDHLRHALDATDDENVEYHIHTALQMLVSDDTLRR
ncbi:hypothetical protein [Halorhabdus amylolytica]|uniref:hypothetical protein n=1 Tax=Halorhabdus amylolytica TaxID=2559573 RepID=UPI00145B143F|nr:hypothetical protein [Halorhabdus amylolytica]